MLKSRQPCSQYVEAAKTMPRFSIACLIFDPMPMESTVGTLEGASSAPSPLCRQPRFEPPRVDDILRLQAKAEWCFGSCALKDPFFRHGTG
ncbi:hypothetical protein Nepgr_033944 [Nepenthes gracilis]|uniref:Uncharacterized protein n=1 Tax=Nepenthes gracilis TaxID=150966 RepID=A0AAD3Y8R0_NEPGR|nr:hypothetical protein Nepgr_033944 [Nepenthes gracilis]